MTRSASMGLGLALAVGIGCGAGMGASSLVVPPARAGTDVQKWEYRCEKVREPEYVTDWANKMGAHGWELVANGEGVWCFKRPL